MIKVYNKSKNRIYLQGVTIEPKQYHNWKDYEIDAKLKAKLDLYESMKLINISQETDPIIFSDDSISSNTTKSKKRNSKKEN